VKKIKTIRNLREAVYQTIKQGIAERALLPGTQLKESELVERLGVSRTPIRDALNQLHRDGMIELVPHKGAYVKNWTREEVVEILILREVLEGLAARLAAERLNDKDIRRLEQYFEDYATGLVDYGQADERFHADLIRACGSARLVGLIRNLSDNLQMLDMRRVNFSFPGRIKESLAEHQKIIEALKAGDGELAEKRAREHFQRTRSHYVRSNPEPA